MTSLNPVFFCERTEVSYTCWIIITILKWQYYNIKNLDFHSLWFTQEEYIYVHVWSSLYSHWLHFISGHVIIMWFSVSCFCHGGNVLYIIYIYCCQEYPINHNTTYTEYRVLIGRRLNTNTSKSYIRKVDLIMYSNDEITLVFSRHIVPH